MHFLRIGSSRVLRRLWSRCCRNWLRLAPECHCSSLSQRNLGNLHIYRTLKMGLIAGASLLMSVGSSDGVTGYPQTIDSLPSVASSCE